MSSVKQGVSQTQAAAMVKRRVLKLCGLPVPEIRVEAGHTNSFVTLFLNAGLEVVETGPFDRDRLLAEGESYLREYYGNDFDRCYPGDAAATFIQRTAEYWTFVQAAGPRYRFVPEVPDHGALEGYLGQGYMAVVFAPSELFWSTPLLVVQADNSNVTLYPDIDNRETIYASVRDLPGDIDLTHGLFAVRQP
jgi:hypothetical protein